jgi:hypothetical protein
MDQAAKNNRAGLFGSRATQLWPANMYGYIDSHRGRDVQRDHPRLRLSTESEDYHRAGNQGYVLEYYSCVCQKLIIFSCRIWSGHVPGHLGGPYHRRWRSCFG